MLGSHKGLDFSVDTFVMLIWWAAVGVSLNNSGRIHNSPDDAFYLFGFTILEDELT
jgi:hypothetical protein